jgi:hypothetical protein
MQDSLGNHTGKDFSYMKYHGYCCLLTVSYLPDFLRRYAAVQEYLDAAHVEEGDNIFLLTDDNSTLEEIHKYHPNYNWTYMNRPRNNGIDGGWEGHIPSGVPEFEVLTILTEIGLASQCSKLVHGNSGVFNVRLVG